LNSPSFDELTRAVAEDRLRLHYQPKVCLLSGEVTGAEALVRWEHGDDGEMLSPDAFLPLAVAEGMLHDITLNLLDQTVQACIALRATGRDLSISMNVAPDDLESQTISDRIRSLLDTGTITSSELQIEITESAVMSNVERVRDDLQRLVSMGIAVLMDDFGVGYSSIDRLSQLPFSSLKLDQGIVRRMGTSRQNVNTVRAAISMARELRMTSVAEGVESEGAYHFLIACGCEQAQGFFIARPMALDDFTDFLASPRTFAGSQIGQVQQAVLNLLHQRRNVLDAAFCVRFGQESVLPSVMDPERSVAVQGSRVGTWYWGPGQGLADSEHFRAFESPFRELYALSEHCLELVGAGVSDARLDTALAALDAGTDRAIALLHALERELVKRPADGAADGVADGASGTA